MTEFKGSDDIDAAYHKFFDMVSAIDLFFSPSHIFTTVQFEFAEAMSPCKIWTSNIHDLNVKAPDYLSRCLLKLD